MLPYGGDSTDVTDTDTENLVFVNENAFHVLILGILRMVPPSQNCIFFLKNNSSIY